MLHSPSRVVCAISRAWDREVVHLGELRGSTASDLLGAQTDELSLQVIELLLEVLLALAHELVGLDLSGRL